MQEILAKDKKNNEIDDNVLHQIQKMFGHLELSDREYFDPENYCFSFKDWENKPVNVSIQQDAQEYLNMMFDKMEQALKITPFKNILKSIYGGKTCT